MPDDVQPDTGQGEAGETGLYDSYLQYVPPEYRDQAREALAADATKVNSRLEEAAALRSTYEPYSQIEGLAAYQPQDLQNLVQWHQTVASSEESMDEWLRETARERGLLPAEPRAEQQPVDMTPDTIQALIDERLQASLAPIEERTNDVATQQFVNSEATLVADRFAELEREHGIELSKEQKDLIVDLGLGAMPDDDASLVNGQDWIGAGFDRFREVYAQAQTAFVADKTAAPKPAITSGGVPVFEPPKTFAEAGERARERLRQSRA